MEFDNYIFDLYGTLIDIHTDEEDMTLWAKMCEYINDKFGIKYNKEDLRRTYIDICGDEERKLKERTGADYPEIRIAWVWERIVGRALQADDDTKYTPGIERLEPEIQDLCTFFRESSRDRFVLYDGVIDLLQELKRSGKGIFLLSNAQRAFTVKELVDTGIMPFFDDIFISSDNLIKKPQGEFMQRLIGKNKLEKEKCVMIGNDIISDVGVAANSGIKSIFVNTYGFGQKKIDSDLRSCNIKEKELYPVIIPNGNIRDCKH